IFINVGGRASTGSIEGLDRVPYFTNSSMMEVDFLPPHLIIIGGSYIGLEFAQMYRRFGSEITIVERAARLLGHEDEDVSDGIHQILKQEGINVRLNAECIAVSKAGDEVEVRMNCASG